MLYFNPIFRLCMGLFILQLISCSTVPKLQETRFPVVKKTTPAVWDNSTLSEEKDPLLEQAFKRYLRTGKAPNIKTDGFDVLAYNAAQQPIIKTTPFEETVVSLEPGEKFTHISSGDPSRWSYAVAVSGAGVNQQQHVLIKPAASDISTNMVITTDRRLYTLRLIASFATPPDRTVRFWYPQDKVAAMSGASVEKTTPVSTNEIVENATTLHFNYRLSRSWLSKTPAWKPIRVFDDGTRTYIEFPRKVIHQDLPAFFVVDDQRQWALTNYRNKSPYFIVDSLFQKGILVMGVGRQQSKVTVTRV